MNIYIYIYIYIYVYIYICIYLSFYLVTITKVTQETEKFTVTSAANTNSEVLLYMIH